MKHPKLILLEEIFNSVTHGLGAVASILGLIFLILIARDAGVIKLTSFIIFGASLFLLYTISTLFHSLSYTKAKKLFLVFDRSAIFILIAGTITPVTLITMNNLLGWSLLGFIWMMAITGITLTAIFKQKFRLLYVPIFLLMGWMGLVMVHPLIVTASMHAVWMLVLGGVLYSAGTIFYAWQKLPFSHTIWHLFVIGGSLCHFMIIARL